MSAASLLELAIGDLRPDPQQPRRQFEEASLKALADSIRERGVLQPLLVRKADTGRGAAYQIVDGERRWRAAKLAKLKAVPVVLYNGGDIEAEQLRIDQVTVNQLREQLKPMELARFLRQLRDLKLTTNDIAARLAKQGHAPMKPADIEDAIALVDMPEWVQKMIDADELPAASAVKLAPIAALPAVGPKLQKRLEQSAGYSGELEPREVLRSAHWVLEENLGPLDRVQEWASNPVHFAWKTRCKGCEHLLQFDGKAYCRSKKLFAQHNEEAKAEGLLPGGKRPEKPKASKSNGKEAAAQEKAKAEQREKSLGEKARDYLHGCLTVALVRAPDPGGKLQRAIVLWRALKNPGSRGTRGSHAIEAHIPDRFKSLEQLTAGDEQQLVDGMQTAALNILTELPWRETHALARQVYPRLEDAWTPDAAFFELFRKAELARLAAAHGCTLPEGRRSWDALKTGELQDALLEQAAKLTRPAILVDLYESEIEKPYNPRSYVDGGDDEDGEGWDDDGDMEDDE